jgi:threonylcarbamoyladenosine tRNA methylthiotransferase MtaB
VRQARQAIRKSRRERPGARLIVTGCAAQIDPDGFAAMEEIDLIVGNADKAAPGGLTGDGRRVRVGDIMSAPAAGAGLISGFSGRARAYVEIQNGCDHRCTFCVIPFGRGNARSSPAERVVDQVRRLHAAGYAEVVLTGVDLTSWGGDLPGAPALGDLVGRILKGVPSLPRLRLSSIDAAEIDPQLMALMGREPRLMPHLHLSLQSGDNLILKRMKRRHSRTQALALINDVRSVRPQTAFGADFIAGFPTETEAAFENTIALVEEASLAFLHVFPYSPRPGTPAARMPQHPRAVIHARAARLRAAGDAALSRHLDRSVGRQVTALVERPGRARADNYTEIAFDGPAQPGALIVGEIVGHDGRRARLGAWTAS